MADYVYMKITRDEYELPVAVADSAAELSRILGLSVNTVRNALGNARRKGFRSQYIRVDVGTEESEWERQ